MNSDRVADELEKMNGRISSIEQTLTGAHGGPGIVGLYILLSKRIDTLEKSKERFIGAMTVVGIIAGFIGSGVTALVTYIVKHV